MKELLIHPPKWVPKVYFVDLPSEAPSDVASLKDENKVPIRVCSLATQDSLHGRQYQLTTFEPCPFTPMTISA